MITDTNNLVSMTDANNNFSQATKKVEQCGDVKKLLSWVIEHKQN